MIVCCRGCGRDVKVLRETSRYIFCHRCTMKGRDYQCPEPYRPEWKIPKESAVPLEDHYGEESTPDDDE